MNRILKIIYSELARSARTLGLMGLVGISLLLSVHAMPPPSAFGVWDRGSSFDPKDHPFLKGLAFNQAWAEVEKQPGVFDWSTLDQAMDTAVRRNQFIYLSLGVGPDAPIWIYPQGVPRVETRDQSHDSWPVYPSILRRHTNPLSTGAFPPAGSTRDPARESTEGEPCERHSS